MLVKMKVHLETYGCALNKADSSIIKGFLSNQTFTDAKNADVVIVNSCAVKLTTENRMFSKIKKHLKANKEVLVTGCLPKINLRELKKYPVSIVDSNSLDQLPKALEKIKENKTVYFSSDNHKNKLSFPHCLDMGITTIVEISEGCLGKCAFCGTKNARGSLTSYSSEDIRNYVGFLVKAGKKEIYLTSQDMGCYGFDIESNLPELLREITSIKGDFLVRIGMMNPNHALKILDKLVEAYKNKKIYKFLHVPVQSGSNKVLKEMDRAHTKEDFEEIIERFRKEIPDVCIATDIIVGFPTETEEDFEETIELMRRIKPDVVNISKFYPRPKTKASEMKKLPTEIIAKRSRLLSKICREIHSEKNKLYVGKKFRCLVTDSKRKLARAPNFKQVFLDRDSEGFVQVKITESGRSFLRGKVLENE